MPRKDKKLKTDAPSRVKETEMKEHNTTAAEENAHNESTGQAESANTPDELGRLQAELSAMTDKYLRLYSDFENFRKRSIKERLDLLKTASEDTISALLPVLDDFDRAIKPLQESKIEDPLTEGVKLIHTKFLNILKQRGLEATNAMGEDFNTDFHEAITSIPAPSEEFKGKVLDVTERGYLLNGKVIRYAKVVVGA